MILGTLLSNRVNDNEHAITVAHSIALVLVQRVCNDGSALVRRELVASLLWLVANFENQFITVAFEMTEKKQTALSLAQNRLNDLRRRDAM